MTCRTYPYQVEHDNGRFVNITINRSVWCRYSSGTDVSSRKLRQDGKREDSEDEAYYRKLRRWNVSGSSGGKAKFLAFMGL